jgi:16S rRNA (cytosine967-C5)-methyltransferase
MRLQFRDYHTISFLEQWWKLPCDKLPSQPLDKALFFYFKENKAIGSKDRQEIAQNIYTLVRWRHKLKALLELEPQKSDIRWKDYLFKSRDIDLTQPHPKLSAAQNVSFTQNLYDLFLSSLGETTAQEVALFSNQPAPVFLRVNTLKTSRSALLKELPETWQAQEGPLEHSIVLSKRVSLFQSSWFKEGLFEMQDLSSQQAANLVEPKVGDHVLDFCAGAGGKSLAIACKMQGKGQLYLHDVRPWALQEAKERLRRACVQNFQLLEPESPHEKKLKHKMDWVIVDAPCSGSGTLRRNPDMKEKITLQSLKELVSLQRTIFEKALSFVKDNGYIVYATCSLLKAENEDQKDHFLKTYPLVQVGCCLQLLPKPGLGDGFFAVVFQKKTKA